MFSGKSRSGRAGRIVAWCVFGFLAGAAQVCPAFQSDFITVETQGNGPDLILVHGFASTPEVWRELSKDLATSHRLHLVAIRGFAGSEPPPVEPESYLQTVRDEIGRYIAEENLKTPGMIGHSMGGLISLRLAAQNPEKVSKVIILDSLPCFQLLEGTSVKPSNKKMLEQIAKLNQSQFAFFLTSSVSALTKTPGKPTILIEWGLKSNRSLYLKYFEEVYLCDARPELDKVQCPVFVFYATDPAMRTSAEKLKTLYETAYAKVKDARVEAIPDSFHFIMWDQPEALRVKVREALAQNKTP